VQYIFLPFQFRTASTRLPTFRRQKLDVFFKRGLTIYFLIDSYYWPQVQPPPPTQMLVESVCMWCAADVRRANKSSLMVGCTHGIGITSPGGVCGVWRCVVGHADLRAIDASDAVSRERVGCEHCPSD
jgi:hypothetical protein